MTELTNVIVNSWYIFLYFVQEKCLGTLTSVPDMGKKSLGKRLRAY